MPSPVKPQNLSNHARLHPLFHFVLIPIFAFFMVFSVMAALRAPLGPATVQALVATALLLLCYQTRVYALRVQDRVIRLEERVRMASLLPEELRSHAMALQMGQYVALRFASDAELAALVRSTLNEDLSGRQIKERIVNWRGDYSRI